MSNFKPFDLEKWRAGDKVQFRNGCPVHEIFFSSHRKELGQQPVISIDDEGIARGHSENGIYNIYAEDTGSDLVMAPKKVKYHFISWENTKDAIVKRRSSSLFLDKEDLISAYPNQPGALFHEIEIEE